MKSFILTAFLICLVSLSFGQQKPNVLLIFSDDQRADAIGYENPYVKTPNLDKLASSGVRMSNVFCQGSHHGAVCAPSRAMLMSGKYLHKVYDKLEGVQTMPMTLRDNGYVTFGTGKWHNGGKTFAAAFDHGKNVFLGGMADHFNTPMRDLKADKTFTKPEPKGHSTDLFTQAAVDFIKTYAEGDRESPFFTYVAYTASHDPRTPPQKYLDMYDPDGMPLPPNYLPLHPFKNTGNMGIRDENLAAFPRSVADVKSSIAEYYGLITHMDDQIGRIISTLKDEGLYDNTIIIFTADHGLGVGSHGLLGKQNLYEHSMKSPFFITGPGIPVNRQSDALLYLLDIYPTLLSILGIEDHEGIDGKDFSPVLRGEKPEVRETLYTSYTTHQRAVKDHRWKLIRYPEIHHTQLFDLINDPFELYNLAEDPAYEGKVEEMMQILADWQTETEDPHPLTADEKKPMDYDHKMLEAKRKPDRHQPEYILEKYFKKK